MDQLRSNTQTQYQSSTAVLEKTREMLTNAINLIKCNIFNLKQHHQYNTLNDIEQQMNSHNSQLDGKNHSNIEGLKKS